MKIKLVGGVEIETPKRRSKKVEAVEKLLYEVGNSLDPVAMQELDDACKRFAENFAKAAAALENINPTTLMRGRKWS